MKAAGSTASLALLLALASGQAEATATRPLQLGLAASAPQSQFAPTPRRAAVVAPAPRPLLAPAFHRSPREAALHARAQDIGERALENVLDTDSPRSLDEERGEGQLQLRFNKRGNAFRDLNKSYREMCDRVSQKIWDDPNGKRVRFDVAGKPGLGIEIPIGHRTAKR
jgi:hypothetical protein